MLQFNMFIFAAAKSKQCFTKEKDPTFPHLTLNYVKQN